VQFSYIISIEFDFYAVVAGCNSLEIPFALLNANGAHAVLDDCKENQHAEDVDH